ncbi:nitroreductase family deazaflavin-dependent oxidoreductase [Frankia sp. Cas3]|uniref:nitroreductase family deazaflavin-dependent oxidoreductase n=1 Tax=Frankia sp. Cas3 TaxID=3073926 RepID=UPI002AD54B64|nr:nitroreductase family deazaflavin-dependent oxidoreductase [Frankia sp. Cas3]
MSETSKAHYRKPGWFTQHIANNLVMRLTRAGVSIWGSRILEVRGRTSGQPRQVPVNVLTHDGRQYLVSARGEGQWVRNLRAADGQLDLLLGRRREHRSAHEVADVAKTPILRAYLRRWKAEVGVFFDGVSADSSDDEIAQIVHKHPVFVLDPVS